MPGSFDLLISRSNLIDRMRLFVFATKPPGYLEAKKIDLSTMALRSTLRYETVGVPLLTTEFANEIRVAHWGQVGASTA